MTNGKPLKDLKIGSNVMLYKGTLWPWWNIAYKRETVGAGKPVRSLLQSLRD